jgi:hypothetical protein
VPPRYTSVFLRSRVVVGDKPGREFRSLSSPISRCGVFGIGVASAVAITGDALGLVVVVVVVVVVVGVVATADRAGVFGDVDCDRNGDMLAAGNANCSTESSIGNESTANPGLQIVVGISIARAFVIWKRIRFGRNHGHARVSCNSIAGDDSTELVDCGSRTSDVMHDTGRRFDTLVLSSNGVVYR